MGDNFLSKWLYFTPTKRRKAVLRPKLKTKSNFVSHYFKRSVTVELAVLQALLYIKLQSYEFTQLIKKYFLCLIKEFPLLSQYCKEF